MDVGCDLVRRACLWCISMEDWLKNACVHEAAHCVMLRHLGFGKISFVRVGLKETEDEFSTGETVFVRVRDPTVQESLLFLASGEAGEHLFCDGKSTYDDRESQDRARMAETIGDNERAYNLLDEQAKRILNVHRHSVLVLALHLKRRRFLLPGFVNKILEDVMKDVKK